MYLVAYSLIQLESAGEVWTGKRDWRQKMLEKIRCPRCHRLLMAVNGQAEVKCSKCKSLVFIDTRRADAEKAVIVA